MALPSILLAMETSTRRGGIALRTLEQDSEKDQLLAVRHYEGESDHAERLFPELREALRDAGLQPTDITSVAVGVGPGSFTGVRVGVMTAKGLALSLGVPVVAASSLEVMAWGAPVQASVRVALLDAKRDELFAAAYDAKGMMIHEAIHSLREHVSSFWKGVQGSVVLVGEAVELLASAQLDGLWVHRSVQTDLPDAACLSLLGAMRIRQGLLADARSLEPFYVRPPDAKRMSGPGSFCVPC